MDVTNDTSDVISDVIKSFVLRGTSHKWFCQATDDVTQSPLMSSVTSQNQLCCHRNITQSSFIFGVTDVTYDTFDIIHVTNDTLDVTDVTSDTFDVIDVTNYTFDFNDVTGDTLYIIRDVIISIFCD